MHASCADPIRMRRFAPARGLLLVNGLTSLRTASTSCWKCGSSSTALHRCSSCSAILPPPATGEAVDHFRYIGVPRRFQLDDRQLKNSFRQLAATLHPDKFVKADERERAASEEHTRLLNIAYKTLSDPLSRARHMLEALDGGSDSESASAEASSDELGAILEWQMRVDECDDESELKTELATVATRVDGLCKQLDDAFSSGSAATARRLIEQLAYLYSIRQHINAKLGRA